VKNVAVFGSTGSIGINALKVIEAFPDRFKVTGLSSFSNTDILTRQIKRFRPRFATIVDAGKAKDFKRSFSAKGTSIFSGIEGLNIIASKEDVDIVVISITGFDALYPLVSAIKSKKHICLANKESIVSAGDIIMKMAKKYGVSIIPIDSEHSAMAQCIRAGGQSEIKRLFLTGSGGPLYNVGKDRFSSLTVNRVLKHPRWKMGRKITVDSATLMNKGLEIIEAHHLFNMPVEMIKLVIHPEAIIHSMCEFRDGSIIAQFGATDMKLPIQYALTYPERLKTPFKSLDFTEIKSLEFSQPDLVKYPCLSLALAAAKLGGTATAVLNAANEIAVREFLDKKIGFIKIPDIIEKVMIKHRYIESPSLTQIFEADLWAREAAKILIR
jgi:1-deoxy-D-xylulose-5-phosphate reductoisomerase